MVELLIVGLLTIVAIVLIPFIRQLDDDLTKKYEQKNKWKENITQYYNGHHSQMNSFGYQDYKYYENEEY